MLWIRIRLDSVCHTSSLYKRLFTDMSTATSLETEVKGTAIHLALSALDVIRSTLPLGSDPTQAAHAEALRAEVQRLTNIPLKELPEELDTMIGEV